MELCMHLMNAVTAPRGSGLLEPVGTWERRTHFSARPSTNSNYLGKILTKINPLLTRISILRRTSIVLV